MGVRFPSIATTTFIGPLPANATETIIYTTPPISEPVDNAPVLLFWSFTCVIGTACTALILTLRRGPLLTSATFQASPWFIPVVAGSRNIASGIYVDTPGLVANQQYSLTVIQTAATGAGSVPDGCLMAMVL